MKRLAICSAFLLVCALPLAAQNNDVKFIADTLVVQADGTYEADPDLATLTFDISSQDKELKPAYENASQAMQKIVALAAKNDVKKEDVSSGVFTVVPYYGGDRKKRAKSFLVQGQIILKVRDFSKLGAILEDSVTSDITDLRSLTYSLADEEAAKQHAVAEAMHRAVGRATAALDQKGQKVGTLRFASVDVKQIVGVASMDIRSLPLATQTIEVSAGAYSGVSREKLASPPPPLPQPEKITVSATVQCAFQIQ
ncbi:MAG: SIMPL domain-containing protein [Candidatus Acidiferrales bacterium]